MTEFKVWRSIVDWVEDIGGIVFAACPPGSSVYDCKKCCLIDPESKKRDEPDIMFAIKNNLFIIECKPSLPKAFNKGLKANSNESDIDKLLRIKEIYEKGNFDQQLKDNYEIDVSLYDLKLGIGYAAGKSFRQESTGDIVHFIVEQSGKVKVMGM